MMILTLILKALLWTTISGQFNMFNTEEMLDKDRLHVNCLHYYVHLTGFGFEKPEYCFGPFAHHRSHGGDFVNTRDQNFTFEKLRQLDVTSNQLLAWSATIDLAERYQDYLDGSHTSALSKEIFFNCTRPWFGPRCEYSFGLGKTYSFTQILIKTWNIRSTKDIPNGVKYLTCYIHIQCDRGGSSFCLDWREICDGKVDCIDGGADEAQCYQLEVNECEENQYRCHNGLCIDNEFLDDNSPQCLDTSDVINEESMKLSVQMRSHFDHEERLCRPGKKQFSCGDGACVPYFQPCKTNRHQYFVESMIAHGNLQNECWIAMICLTKILDKIDRIRCNELLNVTIIGNYLQTCDNIVQFPTVPVLAGHVRFLYRPKDIHIFDINSTHKPSYICYDQTLCDFLVPTYFHENYTCRHFDEVISNPNSEPQSWASLVQSIGWYFHRCAANHNLRNASLSTSLYCCKRSSKCISKSRILDGISDCYLNDDEEAFNISCSIRNSQRSDCLHENKCYSPIIQEQVCPETRLRRLHEIQFDDICDRVLHLVPVFIDGRNYTDETECDQWSCNNYYTRCNGFWNCPYGEDEENCTKALCPSRFLPCVLSHNYTLTCLPAERVGDGTIDCLGAFDEMDHCRRTHFGTDSHPGYHTFRCMNSSLCLSPDRLCFDGSNCPLKDDEAFCTHREGCSHFIDYDGSDVETIVCKMFTMRRVPVSLNHIPQYPPLEGNMSVLSKQVSSQKLQINNFVSNAPDDPAWAWRCNRGNYVVKWLGSTNFTYSCLCPPNFYGNHCEYQNQRVSFTLRVRAVDPDRMYAIVVILMEDDNDQQTIQSFEQFTTTTFRFCEQNFNAYLTYQQRPKNISKNYSIRVDVFEKMSLTYIGSWYANVSFAFLPVNRMTLVVTALPTVSISNIKHCPVECQNGKCMKYMNGEKFFCRCNVGWYGARCHIKIHCTDCSNGSVCVGMNHNRSICVCPSDKWGSRCLLNLSCTENVCENGGRCLAALDPSYDMGYVCKCPMEYTGILCQIEKSRLEISFNNTKKSPFMLLYVFSLVEPLVYSHEVTMKVIPYRITSFQRSLLIYTSTSLKMVFAKLDDNIYAIVIQKLLLSYVKTTLDPKQRCSHVNELLDYQTGQLHEIRRVKHYYALCRNHPRPVCFFDEIFMCLCSNDNETHCFHFEHIPPKCQHNLFCQNGAECWQDDVKCPKTTICVCADCFFGNQCQFYGKGIGLTLDDIFRYEISPNATINDQNVVIKSSIAFAIIILVGGWISSILSFGTFVTKRSRAVGCGLYLLASSITSFLTVNIFAVKFWSLLLFQTNALVDRAIFQRCCISFEFVLKVCLYTDNWLNACVALERLLTVKKGIHYDKTLSIRIARATIFIVPLVVAISFIHEPLKRRAFDDKDEERLWCALPYSRSFHIYNTFISLFHFIGPLVCNFISATFIIFSGIRRRERTQQARSFHEQLRSQLNEHKNLIISPIILIILSVPRLLFSLLAGCAKASNNSWLYSMGYMISFLPSMSIFLVFIVPSSFYMGEFKLSIQSWRRRLFFWRQSMN